LAVQYGLRRERISCTLQDIQATLFLVGLVSLMLACRVVLGLGLPTDAIFESSATQGLIPLGVKIAAIQN
jgi:hypothetical protein